MVTKKTITNNEELYGDLKLIPLNLDAVQQRIDHFKAKVVMALEQRDYVTATKFETHYNFWKGIKENHCAKE